MPEGAEEGEVIELRWLERVIGRERNGDIHILRVLQWRYWIAYAAANGNAMFPLEPQWSDWHDVPTVRE